MKLITFEFLTPLGPIQRIGGLIHEKIVDLNMGYICYLGGNRSSRQTYELASVMLPPDMISFFRTGQEGRDTAKTTIEFIAKRL